MNHLTGDDLRVIAEVARITVSEPSALDQAAARAAAASGDDVAVVAATLMHEIVTGELAGKSTTAFAVLAVVQLLSMNGAAVRFDDFEVVRTHLKDIPGGRA